MRKPYMHGREAVDARLSLQWRGGSHDRASQGWGGDKLVGLGRGLEGVTGGFWSSRVDAVSSREEGRPAYG